jgi:hypothetical protein
LPDRSTLALGKREPLPNRRALMMAPLLTGTIPNIPIAADHFTNVPDWEMGRNDEYGTCGPTSVANLIRLLSQYLGGGMNPVTTDDVIDLYRRSGNPNFPDDDNGVYMHVMLEELLANGIAGRKPLAFAKIEAGDTDTLMQCIAIFGGALLGLDLKVAQQRQGVWDTIPGSGEWGGHAVLAGLYRNPDGTVADRVGVITWQEPLDTTRRFIDAQEDEAWVVIWPEHLGSAAFLEGVDVDGLAAAYEALTGRPFPAHETPPPAPPEVDADAELAVALRRFLRGRPPKYLRTAADAWLGQQ